ncbi:MAG TPA: DUF262 domain-containing protein [Gemmatimonadales bacterium]|nr:DUF262 domain-containing protein [Gemmatimonadales bacterium]
MSTFDSTKTGLSTLLDEIVLGKLQLPDFQRGWVWDDEHIRSLLVSIARSFPIGAVMLLETGGEARFQVRPAEGVTLPDGVEPERLILDGQQRLTSLTQALRLEVPVNTRDDKKREIGRHYYFDIEKALQGPEGLADAIVGVDATRVLKTNFGRDIQLDLSTTEKEIAEFHFPCDQILNSDRWEERLNSVAQDKFNRYMEFRVNVLKPFREYLLPVIVLQRNTSKAAVCLVFEKVNTGGVSLSVFELVTATYAADNFNLRTEWYGPKQSSKKPPRFAASLLLRDTEPTDFLQGISLLHTYERRQADLAAGRTGKEVTAVSAKREHVLVTPLSAYKKWSEPLTKGFLEAEQFLRHLGFHHPKFLPYRAQLVPLAAALAHLGERWLEPQMQDKLTRWFWSGVFGELYGGATETRIAIDLQDLLAWLDDEGTPEPTTVVAAGFQASRLDTLRTRTSAAYRGLYVLLQNQGARDFFYKAQMVEIDRNEKGVDIHHIFPRKWCIAQDIPRRTFNSIVNKTAISLKANRKIGGHAPSAYLGALQSDPKVKMSADGMDEILRSHCIDPEVMRADDFQGFYELRKAALLRLIEKAMQKAAIRSGVAEAENPDEDEDEDDE